MYRPIMHTEASCHGTIEALEARPPDIATVVNSLQNRIVSFCA